jgi:hypothetical protein
MALKPGLVSILMTLCYVQPTWAQAPNATEVDSGRLSDTALELAARRASAGVVVRLSRDVGDPGTPVYSFLHRARERSLRNVPVGHPANVLSRVNPAAVRELHGTAVFEDPTAQLCERLLDSLVPLDIDSTVDGTILNAIGQVTGQVFSDGVVGSCVPEHAAEPRATFKTRGGQPLREVLASAVSRRAGTVWVAVETGRTCSFGLFEASANGPWGPVCLSQIGKPVTGQ